MAGLRLKVTEVGKRTDFIAPRGYKGSPRVMNPVYFCRALSVACTFAVVTSRTAQTRPAGAAGQTETKRFVPLFSKNGVPEGWRVGAWNDVSKPADGNPVWTVKDGVLHGGEPRGSWLMSEKEYGDFILEFEFKLGEQGNRGCALRAPMKGDPACDGLELQMAD